MSEENEKKVEVPAESCANQKCKVMLSKALEAEKVTKLVKQMQAAGCEVPLETFFKCQPCAPNESIAGGFVTEAEKKSQVVLCEDNIEKFKLNQSLVDRTLVHELIHAFDQCRANVDWKNCLHVACTEIRAAHLSGDCGFVNEFNRRNFGLKAQGEQCVRRRAEISVAAHPECSHIAKEAVERVFEPCFADRAPFFAAFH